ncbi:Stp1/IreP family PP2C-type Ser/Thr phosphatase [Fundicoccus culcitae]|uniref:Stp1/IreP family PP2C-type Ser/Thr phosphatase n=1 Tax=Fundicoccus culcitae TaxID=2969821 RepID=A0ABY5P5R0_9LACT|nr:Stp1/IreP family PP2C-type Ser/Thr phosphatase [Fundicoccus culcitae]UUX34082.1 Stp1/IreP family PP2C-type Ser/Thr phosphatase [Fundicoccus culcitae]
MKITIRSNIGKRRSSNQDYADYYVNQSDQYLFILCDGVGGHQAGDVASRMTTDYIGAKFKETAAITTTDDMQQWFNDIVNEVNQHIYQQSTENTHLIGMGTTLVMAVVVKEHIIVSHVGDSRAYVYFEGQLKQITEDHSLINELIRTGEITEAEGQVHPGRNIVTQSIGGSNQVESEINVIPLTEVEVLMLCSDGLTNMVNQEELSTIFDNQRNEENFGEQLIEAANEAGGADNITVVLVSDWNPTSVEEGE